MPSRQQVSGSVDPLSLLPSTHPTVTSHAINILPNMSLTGRDTPRPLQPPVAQRGIKREVAHCVGGVSTWALSTSAEALPAVLALCPPGVRVAAWHRGERPTVSSWPLHAWEPVIYHGGRQLSRDAGDTRRASSIVCSAAALTTLPSRVIGAKPWRRCAGGSSTSSAPTPETRSMTCFRDRERSAGPGLSSLIRRIGPGPTDSKPRCWPSSRPSMSAQVV